MKASDVIRMGRRRSRAPSTAASRIVSPRFCASTANSTQPVVLTTPATACSFEPPPATARPCTIGTSTGALGLPAKFQSPRRCPDPALSNRSLLCSLFGPPKLFIGSRLHSAPKIELVSTKSDPVSALSPSRFREMLSFGWRQSAHLRHRPDGEAQSPGRETRPAAKSARTAARFARRTEISGLANTSRSGWWRGTRETGAMSRPRIAFDVAMAR